MTHLSTTKTLDSEMPTKRYLPNYLTYKQNDVLASQLSRKWFTNLPKFFFPSNLRNMMASHHLPTFPLSNCPGPLSLSMCKYINAFLLFSIIDHHVTVPFSFNYLTLHYKCECEEEATKVEHFNVRGSFILWNPWGHVLQPNSWKKNNFSFLASQGRPTFDKFKYPQF